MFSGIVLALVAFGSTTGYRADMTNAKVKKFKSKPKMKQFIMDTHERMEQLEANLLNVLHLQDHLKEMDKTLPFQNLDTYNSLTKVCGEDYLRAHDRFFDVFDFDQDGLISFNEFETKFAYLCIRQDISMTDVGVQLSRHQLPMFLSADKNADDSLNRKEFRSLVVPFCYEGMYKPIIAQLLQYDLNGDKRINKKEFNQALGLSRSNPFWHDIQKTFSKFDANKNLRLEGNEIFEWQLAGYTNENLPSSMLKKLLDKSTLYDLEYDYALNDEGNEYDMLHGFHSVDNIYDYEENEGGNKKKSERMVLKSHMIHDEL